MENNNDEKMKNLLRWKEEDIKFYTNFIGGILGKLAGSTFEKKVREILAFAETIPGTPDEKVEAIKATFPDGF